MDENSLKIWSQAVPNLFSCEADQILLAELIQLKKIIKAFETATIASSVISLFPPCPTLPQAVCILM